MPWPGWRSAAADTHTHAGRRENVPGRSPGANARRGAPFPPTAPIRFRLVAPLGDQGIASCSNTGITIPECCCQACLEDQIRLYRPSVLNAPAEVVEARLADGGALAEVPLATGARVATGARGAPDVPDLKAA